MATPSNKQIFNKSGTGPAVHHGRGYTRTKQNNTLFVTNIPPPCMNEAQSLFEKEDGFFAFRTVRHMVFVDFTTIRHATKAMRKYQGHRFAKVKTHKGLLIDYDKDPKSKRNRQFNKQVRSAMSHEEITTVSCAACMTMCVRLKLPADKSFGTLPTRKTDGARVVRSDKYVVDVTLRKATVKAIKREKGIEKQYRFKCAVCEVALGYSSTPFEETAKHLFFFPAAVVADGRDAPAVSTNNTNTPTNPTTTNNTNTTPPHPKPSEDAKLNSASSANDNSSHGGDSMGAPAVDTEAPVVMGPVLPPSEAQALSVNSKANTD